MDLNLRTWNGYAINDLDSYATYIPLESLVNLTSNPNYADRAENFPLLTGTTLPPHAFTFEITIKPTDEWTQDLLREQLKGWFSILDRQPHALIAEDRADSNKQYQLIGFPARLTPKKEEGSGFVTFVITIAVMEPVWSSVTANTDTWNITASGQQRTIKVTDSNTPVQPTFTVKPTSVPVGQYTRWCPFYNKASVPYFNQPLDLTNGGINTANLVNFTGISNQINVGGGINAVVTTIPIDTPVGGGLPSVGMGYVGTEQISWTGNTGTSLTGVTRGIGGTTAAVHADNAVIALSKMLANGADILVQYNGTPTNVWVDHPNTASTKVWINVTWQANQTGTLRTVLANSAADVTVLFTVNTTNKNFLTMLKQGKNFVFMIDNEAFTFDPANVDIANWRILSCKRAQKFTSTASHSIAASIIYIENDIWLQYGNSAGSSFVTDDNFKPLLDLQNSTNTSLVQTTFFDTSSANRSAAWIGTVMQSVGKQSNVYTGNQTALANPSTELGMSLIDYLQANLWKAETATLLWSFYHPAGITTVTMSGSKRLISGTQWPPVAGLQKSTNGVNWSTVWTEAKPTLNTWVAWSHVAQSLSGTYTNIRLALIGTIAAGVANEADLQGDTITLTLDNTKTPGGSLGAENSVLYLNLRLTNVSVTPNVWINVAFQMAVNRIITINTLKKTIVYDDGTNIIAALTFSSVRNDWLPLAPGDNILQMDDTSIATETITTSYNDRNF